VSEPAGAAGLLGVGGGTGTSLSLWLQPLSVDGGRMDLHQGDESHYHIGGELVGSETRKSCR